MTQRLEVKDTYARRGITILSFCFLIFVTVFALNSYWQWGAAKACLENDLQGVQHDLKLTDALSGVVDVLKDHGNFNERVADRLREDYTNIHDTKFNVLFLCKQLNMSCPATYGRDGVRS